MKRKQQSIFVGSKVEVCNFSVSLPISYSESPNGKRCTSGVITGVLANGGCTIKFDGYPHEWDYSRSELRNFRRAY